MIDHSNCVRSSVNQHIQSECCTILGQLQRVGQDRNSQAMTEYTMFDAICARIRREAELMREHGGKDLHEMTMVLNEDDWRTWASAVAFNNGYSLAWINTVGTLKYNTGTVSVTLHKEGTV